MKHRCFSTLAVATLAVLAWSVSPAAAQWGAPNDSWYGVPGSYGFGYGWMGWGWTPPYVYYGYGSPYHPTASTTSGGVYTDRFTAFYSGPSEAGNSNVARINVHVPPHARVFFGGAPTQAPGPFRQFVSPPLDPSRTYTYEIRAAWTQDGGTVERTRKVKVHPGQPANVDFLAKSGADREIRSSDEFSPPPRPPQPNSPDENKASTPPRPEQPPKPENPDEKKPPHA
jgi:uncharacterized protein (TIGR03000 family)